MLTPEIKQQWKSICSTLKSEDFKKFREYSNSRSFLEQHFHILFTDQEIDELIEIMYDVCL